MSKKTLVVGASPYPFRYSYRAVHLLQETGHEVFGLGKHSGEIGEIPIQTDRKLLEGESFDTITLYLRRENQEEMYQWILDLEPKRVIFNPGAENPAFEKLLQDQGIQTLRACTLVMLQTQQY